MSNWTFESADSAVSPHTNTATATTGTVTPNVGDLMVLSMTNECATTAAASFAPGDSSVGGASWNTIYTVTAVGKFGAGAWWKIANTNDYNSGSGITTNVTESGGAGTISTYAECDIFRVTGFTIRGIDMKGEGSQTAAGTSFTPVDMLVGSSYPNFADALAWGMLGGGTQLGNGGGGVDFNGVSSMTLCLATNSDELVNQYLGGQKGTTVAVSTFLAASWITSRADAIVIGATFTYEVGGLLPLLGV